MFAEAPVGGSGRSSSRGADGIKRRVGGTQRDSWEAGLGREGEFHAVGHSGQERRVERKVFSSLQP